MKNLLTNVFNPFYSESKVPSVVIAFPVGFEGPDFNTPLSNKTSGMLANITTEREEDIIRDSGSWLGRLQKVKVQFNREQIIDSKRKI